MAKMSLFSLCLFRGYKWTVFLTLQAFILLILLSFMSLDCENSINIWVSNIRLMGQNMLPKGSVWQTELI